MVDTRDDAAIEQGMRLYQEKLQPVLEPEMNGKALAIHLPSGDYEIANSHTEARKALRIRHQVNSQTEGYIVSRTIGPPTPTDLDMASRFIAGEKHDCWLLQ
jgi:hypothetical protein